jgi:homoserine trans-succinylase
LSSNFLNNLDILNEKQKEDVIQVNENKNENNKEILYIIEGVVYNKNTLNKEEVKNLEKDESNFAKTI